MKYYNAANLTWLHIAAKKGNVESVEFLINKGIPINELCQGETALYMAVENENISVVKKLIELGADVNVKTDYKDN